MKSLTNCICGLLLVAALTNFDSFAQTKSNPDSPTQCVPEVARSLVTTQVEDSKTVTETDKRIKILIRVADFLWKPDEAAARKYFDEALNLARERYREKGAEKIAGKNFFGQKQDFRFQVVSAVAKHDSKLADKMLDAILADKEPETKKNGDDFNDNGSVAKLLQVASDLLKINKPTAFQIARRAAVNFDLSNGAMSWHSFLFQAAQFDQAGTDALYAELLSRNQTTARIGDLYFLASYPFGIGRTIGVNNSTMANDLPASFVANPNLQQQFLNVFAAQTLALQPNEQPLKEYDLPAALVAFSMWQDLEPIIAERFPNFVPRLVAAKTHANSLMTNDNIGELGKRRQRNEGSQASFDKKIENLEQANDSENLDFLIVEMIFSAETEDELVKAADWLVKIGEEPVREQATNFVFFKRAQAAVKENRLLDAAAHAKKVSELEHRAVLFFRIAEARLKQERVPARAAEVLEDVIEAALRAPNGVERAQVLLGTAFYFEKYNQFRAAETLSEAVKTINRLENPNLSASFVVRFIKGKKFGYSTSFDVPGYNFEKSFQQVAKKDWNGALLQAENLSDKYLKTLAVIAVVGDCAATTPKRAADKTKPKTTTKN